jgi:REP element-mobilizing transposase RayT
MLIQVMRQVAMKFRTWGGARKGAGRKPKGERAGVPHVERDVLKPRFPVHVTWRMEKGVWNLRTRRCFGPMRQAIFAGAVKNGFRLVHYAVMGNHVHLIVEAQDRVKLATGMQGMGVRIAKALNRVMGRQGRVIGDRYHAHILRTPSEVKRARHYLLTNAQHHYAHAHAHALADEFASQVAVVAPRTWLLRRVL